MTSVQAVLPPVSTATANLSAPATTPTTIAGATAGAPTAPTAATAGRAAPGRRLSTAAKVGIGALVLGGAGAGIAVAVSGGGDDDGPTCGNNRRQGREECDGSDLGGAICPTGGQVTCTFDCKLIFSTCFTCGNGRREDEEECDDGNVNNTDACLAICLFARCGDGFVRTDIAGLEECDDGNIDNTDACVNCIIARCGDGFIQTGVELCDTGAAPNGCPAGAACDATCTTCS
ncbi:MAG: DUF4215 domain-containing protein, partial [Candidatus Binatia bacterium]